MFNSKAMLDNLAQMQMYSILTKKAKILIYNEIWQNVIFSRLTSSLPGFFFQVGGRGGGRVSRGKSFIIDILLYFITFNLV